MWHIVDWPIFHWRDREQWQMKTRNMVDAFWGFVQLLILLKLGCMQSPLFPMWTPLSSCGNEKMFVITIEQDQAD